MGKSISVYRIIGIFLIIIALVGYLTVADDLRHTGEFIGVSSILLSGIILLFVDSKLEISRRLSLQWISIFILLSIPFGGVILDNMPLGTGIGIIIGILFAFIFGKKRKHDIKK